MSKQVASIDISTAYLNDKRFDLLGRSLTLLLRQFDKNITNVEATVYNYDIGERLEFKVFKDE